MVTRLAHAPVLADGRQIVEIGNLRGGDRGEGVPVDLNPADVDEGERTDDAANGVVANGGVNHNQQLPCKVFGDGARVEDLVLPGNTPVTIDWRDEAVGSVRSGFTATGWLAQEAGHLECFTISRDQGRTNADRADEYPRHVRLVISWSMRPGDDEVRVIIEAGNVFVVRGGLQRALELANERKQVFMRRTGIRNQRGQYLDWTRVNNTEGALKLSVRRGKIHAADLTPAVEVVLAEFGTTIVFDMLSFVSECARQRITPCRTGQEALDLALQWARTKFMGPWVTTLADFDAARRFWTHPLDCGETWIAPVVRRFAVANVVMHEEEEEDEAVVIDSEEEEEDDEAVVIDDSEEEEEEEDVVVMDDAQRRAAAAPAAAAPAAPGTVNLNYFDSQTPVCVKRASQPAAAPPEVVAMHTVRPGDSVPIGENQWEVVEESLTRPCAAGGLVELVPTGLDDLPAGNNRYAAGGFAVEAAAGAVILTSSPPFQVLRNEDLEGVDAETRATRRTLLYTVDGRRLTKETIEGNPDAGLVDKEDARKRALERAGRTHGATVQKRPKRNVFDVVVEDVVRHKVPFGTRAHSAYNVQLHGDNLQPALERKRRDHVKILERNLEEAKRDEDAEAARMALVGRIHAENVPKGDEAVRHALYQDRDVSETATFASGDPRFHSRLSVAPLVASTPILVGLLNGNHETFDNLIARLAPNRDAAFTELVAWAVGYWLGDGTRNVCQFAVAHAERENIMPRLERLAEQTGCRLYTHTAPGENVSSVSLRTLIHGGYNLFENILRSLQLYTDKNVTFSCAVVMRQSSIRVRFAVLAGLIDSDGSGGDFANHDDVLSFTQSVNPDTPAETHDAIVSLCACVAQSLGFDVRVSSQWTRYAPPAHGEAGRTIRGVPSDELWERAGRRRIMRRTVLISGPSMHRLPVVNRDKLVADRRFDGAHDHPGASGYLTFANVNAPDNANVTGLRVRNSRGFFLANGFYCLTERGWNGFDLVRPLVDLTR